MAYVSVPVGKGRPIVQVISGGSFSGLEESLIGLLA
jgi:hypothetical protein